MVQYYIIHWWFNIKSFINLSITLMLLSHFSHVRLCATP